LRALRAYLVPKNAIFIAVAQLEFADDSHRARVAFAFLVLDATVNDAG
jgi:hypothetical protein